MRCLFMLLLLGLGHTASAQEVTICYNYGCAVKAKVQFGYDEMAQLDQLFEEVGNAVVERVSIQLAIGHLSRLAGKQTPIHNDKGENFADDGIEGRMDCIDHSNTTTEYLKLIDARGLLAFHRVLEPIDRAPHLLDVHWSARIQETESGEQYAVDTWFFDNGKPAAIFSLRDWLKGAEPHA